MSLLLREYLLSGEVSEAERCLRQLEVPHFHHELVYEVGAEERPRSDPRLVGCPAVLTPSPCLILSPQAVVLVLESTGETPVAMMVRLLKVLWETGLVTLDQMNRVSGAAGARGRLSPRCRLQP